MLLYLYGAALLFGANVDARAFQGFFGELCTVQRGVQQRDFFRYHFDDVFRALSDLRGVEQILFK